MALTLCEGRTYTDSHGKDHKKGYAVIDNIVLRASKNKTELYFEVLIFDSREMREAALQTPELSHYDAVPFIVSDPEDLDGTLAQICYDYVYFVEDWCLAWESDDDSLDID